MPGGFEKLPGGHGVAGGGSKTPDQGIMRSDPLGPCKPLL